MPRKKQTLYWQRKIRRLRRRLRLWFVPHQHNHYRPHLVRRYGLLVLLFLVIGVQVGYNFTKTGSVLGRVTNVTPAGLLLETNDRRVENGLRQLRLQPQLTAAASSKAHDMLANQYWSHDSPNGTQPWKWIEDTGYTYVYAGENLAKNFSTASAAVAAWMSSDGHRANILKSEYRDVGFAIAEGELEGKPTTIIVAMYGAPTTVSTAVAGAATKTVIYPEEEQLSLAARIGVALQSLTPAALTSVALLFIAATVAVTAQIYRRKLPKRLQVTWYRNHGVVKASGLFSIAAFIVLLYGGGQI